MQKIDFLSNFIEISMYDKGIIKQGLFHFSKLIKVFITKPTKSVFFYLKLTNCNYEINKKYCKLYLNLLL